MKFFRCPHCGNIAFKAVDAGPALVCCGEKMTELIPNTTEASLEKHVPVVSVAGGLATISVGSAPHPMEEKHYIAFIAAQTGDTVTIKNLKPGDAPVMTLSAGGKITAYAWCNLHGFWKGEN